MNDIFTVDEQKYLKSYFQKKDATLGVSHSASTALQKSFEGKLHKLIYKKRGNRFNWKLYSASVIAAFSFGAIIAKLTIVPTLMVTTRSIEAPQASPQTSRNGSLNSQRPAVVILGDRLALPGTGKSWMQIVELGSKSADQVIIERHDGAIKIRLDIPNNQSEDTMALRIVLGVAPEAHGWVTVIFTLKP
jgi:hypothetical protein